MALEAKRGTSGGGLGLASRALGDVAERAHDEALGLERRFKEITSRSFAEVTCITLETSAAVTAAQRLAGTIDTAGVALTLAERASLAGVIGRNAPGITAYLDRPVLSGVMRHVTEARQLAMLRPTLSDILSDDHGVLGGAAMSGIADSPTLRSLMNRTAMTPLSSQFAETVAAVASPIAGALTSLLARPETFLERLAPERSLAAVVAPSHVAPFVDAPTPAPDVFVRLPGRRARSRASGWVRVRPSEVPAVEAFVRLRRFERELRPLVMGALVVTYGQDWPSRLPEGMYDGWVAARTREGNALLTECDLIEYANFGDLLTLIMRNDIWREFFKPVLKNKPDAQASLSRLNSYRAPVAHARSVSPQVVRAIAVEVWRLQARLRRNG